MKGSHTVCSLNVHHSTGSGCSCSFFQFGRAFDPDSCLPPDKVHLLPVTRSLSSPLDVVLQRLDGTPAPGSGITVVAVARWYSDVQGTGQVLLDAAAAGGRDLLQLGRPPNSSGLHAMLQPSGPDWELWSSSAVDPTLLDSQWHM